MTGVYSGGTIAYRTTGHSRDDHYTVVRTAEGGELLASYVTRADGLIEQVTDGAGNVTKYQYNQQKQVTGLTITAVDGTTLYSEQNSYDKNGSLLNQSISGAGYDTEKNSYTYDALDRLLNETKNGTTTSYTYDSMGNRLTKKQGGVTTTYAYDLCNKLLSETTNSVETTYAYDVLGNLTEKVSSEGTTTYVYDALNQLAEIITPDGAWQCNTYDASGIRSMIAENGVTTEFMNFNGLVLSGYNRDGELTEHYYYGNSLLAMEQGNYDTETSLYYYLKNSHGDVIGLTDNNGTLTETYRYDAFGTLTSIQSLNENGILEETETALSMFLYAGEQLDNTTGLYYLRARQYNTVIGRFTQEDTYLGDGRNLYVYVSNNPLKYVDPSGHCNKEQGYDTSNEFNIIFYEYPYDEPKNFVDHISALIKAFREDGARATDDFSVVFFYGLGQMFSLGSYHDSEAEDVKYEEAFVEGVGFAEMLVMYPYLVSMASKVVIKKSYTPYYGNNGSSTSLVQSNTSNALISNTDGIKTYTLLPEYALPLLGTNIMNNSDMVFDSAGVNGLTVVNGGNYSVSEINAATYVAQLGNNVVLRPPIGTRGGGGTSDLLVNGIAYDVYTPTTSNPSSIISSIAKKNSQASGIVLDLSQTTVSESDLGDILARVKGAIEKNGGTCNIKDIIVMPK